ncbi:class I SAM-dependent methyltransferase [Rubrobacter aplysinae]|uniref:class I SAM-dependent methyltransferase n=1 Tax=Rubrobacter aplysinae TaxID=909625 RepID=UPI00128C741E|nr:methyltransferase domain-containing protein [Rubrobacter aplysinae]
MRRLFSNIRVYEHVGGLYDATLGFWSREVRRKAAGALDLEPGQSLLIAGVGTGMELPYLPRDVRGVGVDLSRGMLERAHRRRVELGMSGLSLGIMDARALAFPDGSGDEAAHVTGQVEAGVPSGAGFDAIYLPLIVTVVPDGSRVLAEAARVTRPGGRVVIADRFWPEDKRRPAPVRAMSWALGHFAMRFDHRFSEIQAGAPHLVIEDYQRVSPGGFFHLITLRKSYVASTYDGSTQSESQGI